MSAAPHVSGQLGSGRSSAVCPEIITRSHRGVQWGGRQDKSRDGAQVARPCGTMGCCASRAAAGMAHFAISQMISILKAPALILAGRMSRG